jgi:hydrogenase expression/formation protein HypC
MCLGVPGRVVDVGDEDGVRMGKIDFGGVARKVCLAHVPEVVVGDYVLVHVGFALQRLDEHEARRTLALLEELGQLDELQDPPDLEPPP